MEPADLVRYAEDPCRCSILLTDAAEEWDSAEACFADVLADARVLEHSAAVWAVFRNTGKPATVLKILHAAGEAWATSEPVLPAAAIDISDFNWQDLFSQLSNNCHRNMLLQAVRQLLHARDGRCAFPTQDAGLPGPDSDFARSLRHSLLQLSPSQRSKLHHLPYLSKEDLRTPRETLEHFVTEIPSSVHGRVMKVMVVGAAGIGKSQLISELLGVPDVDESHTLPESGVALNDGVTRLPEEIRAPHRQLEHSTVVLVDSPGAVRNSQQQQQDAWKVTCQYLFESLILSSRVSVDVVLYCKRGNAPRLEGADKDLLETLQPHGVPVLVVLLQSGACYHNAVELKHQLQAWAQGQYRGTDENGDNVVSQKMEHIKDVVIVQALASQTRDGAIVSAFGLNDLAECIAHTYMQHVRRHQQRRLEGLDIGISDVEPTISLAVRMAHALRIPTLDRYWVTYSILTGMISGIATRHGISITGGEGLQRGRGMAKNIGYGLKLLGKLSEPCLKKLGMNLSQGVLETLLNPLPVTHVDQDGKKMTFAQMVRNIFRPKKKKASHTQVGTLSLLCLMLGTSLHDAFKLHRINATEDNREVIQLDALASSIHDIVKPLSLLGLASQVKDTIQAKKQKHQQNPATPEPLIGS